MRRRGGEPSCPGTRASRASVTLPGVRLADHVVAPRPSHRHPLRNDDLSSAAGGAWQIRGSHECAIWPSPSSCAHRPTPARGRCAPPRSPSAPAPARLHSSRPSRPPSALSHNSIVGELGGHLNCSAPCQRLRTHHSLGRYPCPPARLGPVGARRDYWLHAPRRRSHGPPLQSPAEAGPTLAYSVTRARSRRALFVLQLGYRDVAGVVVGVERGTLRHRRIPT